MINDKNTHGGKREGAGRPAKKAADKKQSVVKRIPVEKLDDVNALLSQDVITFPKKRIPQPAVIPAAKNPEPLELPLYLSRIAAGFPSPADDYVEMGLDLNQRFIFDRKSTYHAVAEGDSMDKAGIFDNTILTVCKGVEPQNNDLVLAYIDGGYTVKRYRKQGNKIYLIPESTNPVHKTRVIETGGDEESGMIWGKVIATHNQC